MLELGVGTGRIALALAAAGHEVVGLDASSEMLAVLANKDPSGAILSANADAGDPDSWSGAGVSGRFHCVLAACNLLLNLTAADAQRRCIAGAAEVLAPGGVLITELSSLELPDEPERRLELSSVDSDAVVLIATDSDPLSGLVEGRHIELRDGEPVRMRPWAIRSLASGELDRWCADAGLALAGRYGGWDRTPSGDGDTVMVSAHRRHPG